MKKTGGERKKNKKSEEEIILSLAILVTPAAHSHPFSCKNVRAKYDKNAYA